MNNYSILLWTCILVLFVLPWFLATLFAWVYTEVYEKDSSVSESPSLGYITALLQTSSSVVYVVFMCALLLCLGLVGRPDSHCAYCCLVSGIPVFCVVPVAAGSLVLISALERDLLIDRNIGLTAAVLSFFSTLPCCCILVCSLTCGTRAKGKRSRYPIPLAYIPVLGDWQQREDKWEKKRQQRKFTNDYPSDYPPGPAPSYKVGRSSSADKGSVKSYVRSPPHASRSRGLTPVDTMCATKRGSGSTATSSHPKGTDKATKVIDGSRKRFTLTSFLNARKESSCSTYVDETGCQNRRHSEPAINLLTTAEKGQPLTTENISKPNRRKGSITNTTFKDICVVSDHQSVTISDKSECT